MDPIPQTASIFRPWELRSDALQNDEGRRTDRVNSNQADCFLPVELWKIPNDKSERFETSSQKRKEFTRKKCLTSSADLRFSEEKISDSLHQKVKSYNGSELAPQSKRATLQMARVSHSSKFSPSFLETKLSNESASYTEFPRKKRPKDKACSKCHNTFSNQAQLDAHMRGHFNVRNYGCEYIVDSSTKRKCGKRFVRKEELTRHQRTHTGEKPHLCRICSKGFGRKDHLQKHEKTHERSQPSQYQFQMTPFNFPLPPAVPAPFPLMAPPRTDIFMPLAQSDLLLHSLNLLSYSQSRNLQVEEKHKFPTPVRSYPQSLPNTNSFGALERCRDINKILKPRARFT